MICVTEFVEAINLETGVYLCFYGVYLCFYIRKIDSLCYLLTFIKNFITFFSHMYVYYVSDLQLYVICYV